MTEARDRPMAGLATWILTVDRIGNITQARGLAEVLGLDATLKIIAPRGIAAAIAPFGWPDRRDRFGVPGAPLGPPWPDVGIGIGRRAVPYLRALARAHGGIFTIMMMDPNFFHRDFDVVWVPEHDGRSGRDIVSSPFAMHGFSPERLAALRAELPTFVRELPGPRITVVLGGRNKQYAYPPEDDQRLARALTSMAKLGCSFLVTPSRRSHPELLEAVRGAVAGRPHVFWDCQGENPYGTYLAAADQVVVTGDSANMTSEALATGRPVHVFIPSGEHGKFARLHETLFATGVARPLAATVETLAGWPASPIYGTDVVAREIERRWLTRQRRAG
jgi:mitochondrial fission protein ELM1